MSTVEEIQSAIEALPASDQARLRDWLLARDEAEYEAAWAEECRQRLETFDQGQTEAADSTEVFKTVRERLGK